MRSLVSEALVGALSLTLPLAPGTSGATEATPPPPAPERVTIDLAGAPRGPAPRGDWFDPRRQAIHSDGRTVALEPRLRVPLVGIQRADGGWVSAAYGVNNTRIIRIRRDGSWSTVVREPDEPGGELDLDFLVSPGGGRLAYASDGDDASHVVVARVDGTEVDRFATQGAEVLDWAEGRVWVTVNRYGGGAPPRLAEWRPGSEPTVRTERRLGRLDGLDVRSGVAWRDDSGRRGLKAIPLRSDDWSAWTRSGYRFDGVSPGGRYALTYTDTPESPEEEYGFRGRLVVRDARTGSPVTVFTGRHQVGAVDGPVWESRRTILAVVHDEDLRLVLVRLHVGGRVEVLSRAGTGRGEQPGVVPIT
ncbi:hypothetical protein [Nocardioides sp. Arc9.136]|uniref:hypothetical protein n=1 Tax=Nocardioides sp. Arc9.136 TaxID=2996826 RepID=UPI002665C4D3|nr:hypothetical protein [Nocardioides sp. Arc9.136]WKN48274.1 hypothetical protein OSR43_19860 [Nocardioides sp. Arc9.136]